MKNSKLCFNESFRKDFFTYLATYYLNFRVDKIKNVFECRKVVDFASLSYDWLEKTAGQLFHPIRSESITNRDSLARVLSRFASWNLEFWFVHCTVFVLCDWLVCRITLGEVLRYFNEISGKPRDILKLNQRSKLPLENKTISFN